MGYYYPERDLLPQVIERPILQTHPKAWCGDGVSLEMQNMARALRERGMMTFFASSDVPEAFVQRGDGLKLGLLGYQHPDMLYLNTEIFASAEENGIKYPREDDRVLAEGRLRHTILSRSEAIQRYLEKYIKDKHISIVDIRNISLPWNLPLSIAWKNIIKKSPDLMTVIHCHDFIWEPSGGPIYESGFTSINEMIQKYSPPIIQAPNVTYVTISSIAQQEFEKRTGIRSKVIPDSFDFSRPSPFDNLNQNEIMQMRNKLGFRQSDIVIGVMSRIVRRKGIEDTLQIAAAMKKGIEDKLKEPEIQDRISREGGIKIFNGHLDNESRIVVAIFQKEDTDWGYYSALKEMARGLGIEFTDVSDKISHNSNELPIDFYDAYATVNGTCFPSRYEGFGNQILEAVWAGLVPIINRYKVYRSDIAGRAISPEDEISYEFDKLHQLKRSVDIRIGGQTFSTIPPYISEKIATAYLDLLMDPDKYRALAEKNRYLAAANFDIRNATQKFIDLTN